jgi:hypothetical protein
MLHSCFRSFFELVAVYASRASAMGVLSLFDQHAQSAQNSPVPMPT